MAGKRVLDMGCGCGHGAAVLCINAASVLAVDINTVVVLSVGTADLKRLTILRQDFFELAEDGAFDVVVSVEVFEHMTDLDRYLRKAARLAPYFFVTTPLAPVSAQTDNPDHVAEYSRHDFLGLLRQHFDVLDEFYQRSDLTITREPCLPSGSSMQPGHAVQMAWCRSKSPIGGVHE